MLANKQAKAALTADVDVLHTAVDAALHWVAILASNLIRVLHLPTDIMPLTGVQLTAGADVNSLSQAQAVAFAAGEGTFPVQDTDAQCSILTVAPGRVLFCNRSERPNRAADRPDEQGAGVRGPAL